MTTYRHTPDMGEISGFGEGGDPRGMAYEQCCQDMLEAGVKWLVEHPGVELEISSYKDVYGICMPKEGTPAEELSKAVLDAAKGEATGAMHHAIMERCFAISKNSWEWYCAKLREHEKENPE